MATYEAGALAEGEVDDFSQCDSDSSVDGYSYVEAKREAVQPSSSGAVDILQAAGVPRARVSVPRIRHMIGSLSLEQLRDVMLSAATAHEDTLQAVIVAADDAGPCSPGSISTTSITECEISNTYFAVYSPQSLPLEVLNLIFSTLDHASLARAACVSRHWRQAAAERWHKLHRELLAGTHMERRRSVEAGQPGPQMAVMQLPPQPPAGPQGVVGAPPQGVNLDPMLVQHLLAAVGIPQNPLVGAALPIGPPQQAALHALMVAQQHQLNQLQQWLPQQAPQAAPQAGAAAPAGAPDAAFEAEAALEEGAMAVPGPVDPVPWPAALPALQQQQLQMQQLEANINPPPQPHPPAPAAAAAAAAGDENAVVNAPVNLPPGIQPAQHGLWPGLAAGAIPLQGQGNLMIADMLQGQNWTNLRRRRTIALNVPRVISLQQFTADCYKMELWRAINSGDGMTAANLLARGACPDAAQDAQPVLWCAMRLGFYNLVKLLLENGASTVSPIDDGAYLYYCVDTGNAAVMRQLIASGAEVNAMTKLCPHNWEDRWRSAFVAAMESDNDLKQFLVRQGADPVDVVASCTARLAGVPLLGTRCMTALQHACINGSTQLVNILLQAGADANITAGGKGRTALHLTIRHLKPNTDAFLHVIDALLAAQADVSAPDAAGNTPLALLIKRGAVTQEALEIRRVQQAMESVLKSGGDPNTHVIKTAGAVAVPALLTAVNHQHYGMARVLVNHGADVNCVDPRTGCTALHKVLGRINDDVQHKPRARSFFDFLCSQRGLNPQVVAKDGMTAWQLARDKGLWNELGKMSSSAKLPLPPDVPYGALSHVPTTPSLVPALARALAGAPSTQVGVQGDVAGGAGASKKPTGSGGEVTTEGVGGSGQQGALGADGRASSSRITMPPGLSRTRGALSRALTRSTSDGGQYQ